VRAVQERQLGTVKHTTTIKKASQNRNTAFCIFLVLKKEPYRAIPAGITSSTTVGTIRIKKALQTEIIAWRK
jgi:hypothetical protein